MLPCPLRGNYKNEVRVTSLSQQSRILIRVVFLVITRAGSAFEHRDLNAHAVYRVNK